MTVCTINAPHKNYHQPKEAKAKSDKPKKQKGG